MKQPIKYITALLLVAISIVFLLLLINSLKHIIMNIGTYYLLFIGMLLYYFQYRYKKKRGRISEFWDTFEHELVHSIFAIIFGGKISSFNAKETTGVVNISKSNYIILLAPYFFPTYTIVFIIIHYIAKVQYQPWLLLLLGFSTAYHIRSNRDETHGMQTDITKPGKSFSYSMIGVMSVIFYSLVFSYVAFYENYLEHLIGAFNKILGLF